MSQAQQYVDKLKNDLAIIDTQRKRLVHRLNTAEMQLAEERAYWTYKSSHIPDTTRNAIHTIGSFLDTLSFDAQPRRITFGRTQYKLVSRVEATKA
jgi:hypothetical protein